MQGDARAVMKKTQKTQERKRRSRNNKNANSLRAEENDKGIQTENKQKRLLHKVF